MFDQTQSTLKTQGEFAVDSTINVEDREILRNLANKVAELAARPIEDEKRELWYQLNALKPTRPLVFCDPENGWNEIITINQIECQGELAQRWEMNFIVSHVYDESDWGMHEEKIGGIEGGSYVWESPLKSYDDLDNSK
jgi:hypothetical protein